MVEDDKKPSPDLPITLTDNIMRSYRIGKIFRDNTERINHMDFSKSGDLLISSGEDDQIIIYDCLAGSHKRLLNSKKYGVDLIHFTHHKNTCIHSSTKLDETIRYLSLHDNKYLRYFPGHTNKVTTLCMSPTDDTFISGSLDKTMRLWDLRSPNCQGLMHLLGKPVAAFDPEGLIFAAGVNNESIKLYDLRSFDKGPFATFKFNCEKEGEWCDLKFAPNGKSIMITSLGSVIRLIDAFSGTQLHSFTGYSNKGSQLEATYSPDSNYVIHGSDDGIVHVWHVEGGYKVCSLNADQDHPGHISCLQFNPKYNMFASGCSNMAFWINKDLGLSY